jgi:phage shock protein PspC (stress-responsive transcriptional regulator)
MQVNRRSLYRCRHDRRIAGVASGLAEYFDLDVSLVRVLWVLSIFAGGFGILLYIAFAIIVPLEPEFLVQPGAGPAAGAAEVAGAGADGDQAPAGATGWHTTTVPYQHQPTRNSGLGMTFFGIVLIIFGGLALVDGLLPAWADSGRFLWPAFLLAFGGLLVATAIRRRPNEE